jgi:hypothetical protein
MIFDGANKRIILQSSSTSSSEIWSEWVRWLDSDPNNRKWLPALKQVGGDDLGSGLLIPPYIFLLNGWRVRPMESNHLLVISGNLFVDGGGQPVVNTLGAYNVSAQYTVPVQAQGYSTSAGSTVSASDIWEYANRTLTSGGTVADVDYAQIATSVWNSSDRTLTQASGLTVEQNALLEEIASNSAQVRKSISNKVSIVPQPDSDIIVIYDDDGVTPILRTQVSKNKTSRIRLA